TPRRPPRSGGGRSPPVSAGSQDGTRTDEQGGCVPAPGRLGPREGLEALGRRRTRRLKDGASYFFVSQKILSISPIRSSNFWPCPGSVDFFASPASLVAFQNRSCSCG